MKQGVRPFPKGTSLETALPAGMDRLEASGRVVYPAGYQEELLSEYNDQGGVIYPHIFLRIGDPNILKHPIVKRMIEKGFEGANLSEKRIFDYGCGIGDDTRIVIDYITKYLVESGLPEEDAREVAKQNVRAFDVVRDDDMLNTPEYGYDLFLDREEMKDVFIVDEPKNVVKLIGRGTQDAVWSGSVIHAIGPDDDGLAEYVDNAYAVLKNGGGIFGTTLGYEKTVLRHGPREEGDFLPPTVLSSEDLKEYLGTRFDNVEIFEAPCKYEHEGKPLKRLFFSGVKKLK